jgi:diguanylate cyclase (GGDEF)-like protein
VTLVILLGYAILVYISFSESIRRDQTQIYNSRVKTAILLTEHLFWNEIRRLICIGPEEQVDIAAKLPAADSQYKGLFTSYATYIRETGERLKVWPAAATDGEWSQMRRRLGDGGDSVSSKLFFNGDQIFFILQEEKGPTRHLLYLFQVDRAKWEHLLRENLLLDQSTLLLSQGDRVRLTLAPKDPAAGGLLNPLRFKKLVGAEEKSGLREGRFVPLNDEIFLFSAPIDFFGMQLDYLLPSNIFLKGLDRLKNRVIAATLILGWIAAWVVLIVSYRLSRPVVNLAQVTNDMIAFNYQTPFEFAPSNDEIGDLARSVEIMRQRIEQLVTKDPLTKTYNRRYLMHMFQSEYAKAVRTGGELACLILDLDHFKQINDTYGHQVGDEVLQEMGRLLMKNLRKYDTVATVARYGGEEFVVLLPDGSKEGALSVAERLRRKVEGHPMPRDIFCTVSCGVALFDRSRHGSPDHLLHEADQAMYSAKKQGRNQVVVFT